MKNLLILTCPILFLLLFWCIICPWIYCSKDTVFDFKELNSPKKESSYPLPKGYHLLYNSNTKEFEVNVLDKKWSDLSDLRLCIYSDAGMNSTMLSVVPKDEDATRFKDSSIAKYYAHLWYNSQNIRFVASDFKPLTK